MYAILAAALAFAEPTPDYGDLVDDAKRVAASDTELARDLLGWILDSDAPTEVKAEAKELLVTLPPGMSDWAATAKLTGWQSLAGAWVLGPAVALSTPRYIPPTLSTTGIAAGGAAGVAGALFYAKNGRLTPTRATAIIGSQQLGAWNGVWISLAVDDTRYDPALGSMIGLGAGALGGYTLAGVDLHDGAIATAHSGALWGTGLAFSALFLQPDPDPEAWRAQWVVLGLGSNIGAIGGYGLGQALDFDRGDVQMANLGIGLGVATGGMIVAVANSGSSWLEPPAVTGILTVSGIVGGVGTVAIQRAIRGTPGGLALSVVPSIVPIDGGLRTGLSVGSRL